MVTLLATVLYLIAAALSWRDAIAHPQGSGAGRPLARVIAGTALLLHTVDLTAILRNEAGFALTIGDALSLWGWVIAASTLAAGFVWQLKGVATFLYVITAFLASFAFEPRTYPETAAPGIAFNAHVALSTLAAGWLSITAVCAVLLVAQSTRLAPGRMKREKWPM